MADYGDTKLDLSITYELSKLTCWKPFYFAHVSFAYLIMISGVLCFLSRVINPLKWLHKWFGKLYILFMLWATATSLLIHNEGLPIGVIWSFAWVLLGLSFGWLAISIHMNNRGKISQLHADVSRREKILRRIFSLKTLHGCLMFVSWINIAGRVFVTPLNSNFECYSYGAYKPVVSLANPNYTQSDPVTFLPQNDPNYPKYPWAYGEGRWAATLSLGPFFAAAIVAFVFIFFDTREKANQENNEV